MPSKNESTWKILFWCIYYYIFRVAAPISGGLHHVKLILGLIKVIKTYTFSLATHKSNTGHKIKTQCYVFNALSSLSPWHLDFLWLWGQRVLSYNTIRQKAPIRLYWFFSSRFIKRRKRFVLNNWILQGKKTKRPCTICFCQEEISLLFEPLCGMNSAPNLFTLSVALEF